MFLLRFPLFLLVLVGSHLSAEAQDTRPSATPAQDSGRKADDRILFDFTSKNLVVYGMHSGKTHGRKNGVDAEFAARREGKQALVDYFDSVCTKAPFDEDWTSRLHPKAGWNGTSLTSQGSEIFPEATLLIKLTAPFSDVFTKYPPRKVNPIKSSSGQPYVFAIPAIPGNLLRCGTITLKLSGGRTIQVAPGFASEGEATSIRLILGKSGLEPASQADEDALKRSEFGDGPIEDSGEKESPLFLPVGSTHSRPE